MPYEYWEITYRHPHGWTNVLDYALDEDTAWELVGELTGQGYDRDRIEVTWVDNLPAELE